MLLYISRLFPPWNVGEYSIVDDGVEDDSRFLQPVRPPVFNHHLNKYVQKKDGKH